MEENKRRNVNILRDLIYQGMDGILQNILQLKQIF